MTFSARNSDDSIEVRIKLSARDFAFLSQERFSQLMPALQKLRSIPNNRKVYPTEDNSFFEIYSMEFTEFVLELCRNDIAKIDRFKQFSKGST